MVNIEFILFTFESHIYTQLT